MKRRERIKEIKERRYKEILEAATAIFARHGYHLTDVEVIADKLGVGKGTIYRYFPTKEKLFTAIMEQMMHQLAGIIRSKIQDLTNPVRDRSSQKDDRGNRAKYSCIKTDSQKDVRPDTKPNISNGANPLERLRAVIRGHMEFFEKNMHILEVFIHYRSEYKEKAREIYLRHYSRGFQRTQALVQECIDRGLIKASSAKLCASILIDIFYGILFTTFLGASKKVFREKGRYLEELLLCADKKVCQA